MTSSKPEPTVGSTQKAPRENTPVGAETVHAPVSKTGKSAQHDRGHITPKNVKYLPNQDTLREAAAELERLGFFINLTAPTARTFCSCRTRLARPE
jgi:hypothetical protein